MVDSKLIRLLQKMDAQQAHRFVLYLRSPYHIRYEKLVRFGLWVMQKHPEFPASDLSKELAFSYMYSGLSYKEQAMNDLMSYLLTALENFLILEENTQKVGFIDLLPWLRENGENREFIRIAGQVQKKLENQPRSAEYYRNLIRLSEEQDRFYIGQDEKYSRQYLQQQLDALDGWYMGEKYRMLCEMQNRTQVLSLQFDTGIPLPNISELEERSSKTHPQALVYSAVYTMLTEPDDSEAYSQLLQLLDNNKHHLSRLDLKDVYDHALNFCIKKVNAGYAEYNRKLFELYRQILELDLLSEKPGEALSQWDYKNIISTALRVGEWVWAEAFLEKYRTRLAADQQENAWRYNKALICFESSQFAESLKLLNQVEFTDPFYALGARSILVRTYYEQEEEEALRAAVAAFKNYLTRSRLLSDYHRRIYRNFLRAVSRMAQERERRSTLKRKDQIKTPAWLQELNTAADTAYAAWIKEKAALLQRGILNS